MLPDDILPNTERLRYFEVEYVDATSFSKINDYAKPRIVFFLAEGQDDEAIFQTGMDQHSSRDVWVLYRNGADIRSAIQEVLALEAVQRGAQALSSDPVASRELKERLKAARVFEESILDGLAGDPAKSDWHWNGSQVTIQSRRVLQKFLSEAMDQIYARSPKIHNELVNREKLSSQAAAARNKLFQLMLTQAKEAGLGIEKYPPERSMYRSIFERGELHTERDDGLVWNEPDLTDPLSLRPLWNMFDQFIASTEDGPKSIDLLMEEASAPPYGVKSGVFPILFLHYYLIHKHEIAAYEDGLYMPALTYEHLERLVKRPGAFFVPTFPYRWRARGPIRRVRQSPFRGIEES